MQRNLFSEIWEILIAGLKKVVKSRLFVVSILCIVMITSLVLRLFKLQIVEGENYQENYVQKTLKTVSVSGTRGDIYDRSGKLLAYNKLAYAVSISDNGYYQNGYQRNQMLLKLIPILEKHGETLKNNLISYHRRERAVSVYHRKRGGKKAVSPRCVWLKKCG